MSDLQYFLGVAIRSCRGGKFYYRPWKQLLVITMLETRCLILTGKTLNKL